MDIKEKIRLKLLKKKAKLIDYRIFQDWKANKNNPKGRFVMMLFRITHLIGNNIEIKIFFWWFIPIYIFFVDWVLGIEIWWSTVIGSGTQLWHGQALIINPGVVIGNNCLLRHCITIGNNGKDNISPVIGNNVEIGANSCIIGNIKIGDNVKIGSGSVVVKDVPPNCIVAGNPARIIRMLAEPVKS